jgi:hypothetical protein
VLIALLAALPVSACSATNPAPHTVVTDSPAARTVKSAVPQYTGEQLASVLLPRSYFPDGYSDDAAADENSGSTVDASPGTNELEGMTCVQLYSYLDAGGIGESSFVTGTFADKSMGYTYTQAIYQFPSVSLAESFFTDLRPLVNSCRSFTQATYQPTSQITFAVRSVRDKEGNPAFGIYEVVRYQQSGGTATDISMYDIVRSGTDVYETVAYAGTIGGVRQPPTDRNLDDIIDYLVAGIAKLRST